MREVSGLATTIKDTVAKLKAAHVAATKRFNKEVSHSETNLAKVNSFTDELATANKEIEDALGDTGSNFPSSEDMKLKHKSEDTDINGVTPNKGE